MIGIGVVTYNRLNYLKKVINSIIKNTTSSYFLIVADDGSSDGTKEYLNNIKVPMIGGKNRGIAWNKNRILYSYYQYLPVDNIIMLEDDTLPYLYGWEKLWIESVQKAGYCTYGHPKMASQFLGGSGSPADPFACTGITSQCSAVSRAALEKAGFFDTRFKGYGVEDGEWSTRLRRCNYGIIKVPQSPEGYIKANFMINGGVHTIDVETYRDNASVARNREIFQQVKNDPIPRLAWQNDSDKLILCEEIESGLSSVPATIRLAPKLRHTP